jgi:phage regulator Rha-like protein
MTSSILHPIIEHRILAVRNQHVLLDSDLAVLYGVQTKVLVQAVKRKVSRFPADFMFQLEMEEWAVLRSQFVTSNPAKGGRRYPPYAFTEHGVAMLSSVLNSEKAIAVNIEVMRAFVRMRGEKSYNDEFHSRIEQLEAHTKSLSEKQDETAIQIRQILDAMRALMAVPPQAKKRPIGFVTPDDS